MCGGNLGRVYLAGGRRGTACAGCSIRGGPTPTLFLKSRCEQRRHHAVSEGPSHVPRPPPTPNPVAALHTRQPPWHRLRYSVRGQNSSNKGRASTTSARLKKTAFADRLILIGSPLRPWRPRCGATSRPWPAVTARTRAAATRVAVARRRRRILTRKGGMTPRLRRRGRRRGSWRQRRRRRTGARCAHSTRRHSLPRYIHRRLLATSA